MTIRDVSKQYAALMCESADEQKKYEEACEEACRLNQEAEKRAIDEFETEEVSLEECGFTEEKCEEELQEKESAEADEEVEKQAKDTLEKAKKSVTSALNEEEVEKWLDENKAKIEKIFADSKLKDEKIQKNVRKLLMILERYSAGKLDESMISEKKGDSPVWQLVKAIMRFFNWVLMLGPKLIIGSAWLISKIGDFALALQKKIDVKLSESMELDIADEDELQEREDVEEIAEDGVSEKREEKKVDENEGDPATHLLDPVGVHASTASLAGQDAAAISVVEKLLKRIEDLESKLNESKKIVRESNENKYIEQVKAAKNDPKALQQIISLVNDIEAENARDDVHAGYAPNQNGLNDIDQLYAALDAEGIKADIKFGKAPYYNQYIVLEGEKVDEAQYDLTRNSNSIASVLIAHQAEWQGITDKNALVEYLKKMLSDVGIDTPYSRKMILIASQKRSALEIIDYLFRGVILGGKGLQMSRGLWREEECENVSESQYDAQLMSQKLTYGDQLKFKRWAMRKLNLKGDPFYFDYVTGVDAKTSDDLPGLVADGSITWGQALEALRNHFGIFEEENPDDAKTDALDIAGDKYEQQSKEAAELSVANEADTSFDDEVKIPDEDDPNFKRAKQIQELSFERALTKAEEDEFREILKKLNDYQKDSLLGNLSKTGFARPSNHTGLRANDEQGNRVEIPPLSYTEDPDDRLEKVSIAKRQQREQAKADAEAAHANALSSLDSKLSSDQDLATADWNTIINPLNKRDKKRLMDEILDQIDADYAGKTDKKSVEDRENEFRYIWKLFGYDPDTRELGRAWNVSHAGAGKFQRSVLAKIKDAMRVGGITSLAGLRNASEQQMKKMLDFLKAKTAGRRSWKIDRKDAEKEIESAIGPAPEANLSATTQV